MHKITPLPDKPFGAEVVGLDLKDQMDDATKVAINEAFLKHIALVFRDQNLTAAQYRDGVSNFGEPMKQHNERFQLPGIPVVSRIINREKMRPASMWHTDHTNHERPPKATVLYARKLPSKGGDTCLANMYAGLDHLDDKSRSEIDGMYTINHLEADNPVYSSKDREQYDKGITQPIVRTHPETGRQALYFHVTKARGIVGMDPEKVRPFLNDLLAQAVKPENSLRHKWRLGDVLMFDNRCTMHRADPEYDMSEERLLWRIILRGDRPI